MSGKHWKQFLAALEEAKLPVGRPVGNRGMHWPECGFMYLSMRPPEFGKGPWLFELHVTESVKHSTVHPKEMVQWVAKYLAAKEFVTMVCHTENAQRKWAELLTAILQDDSVPKPDVSLKHGLYWQRAHVLLNEKGELEVVTPNESFSDVSVSQAIRFVKSRFCQ